VVNVLVAVSYRPITGLTEEGISLMNEKESLPYTMGYSELSKELVSRP
jgi:hypothetical protein